MIQVHCAVKKCRPNYFSTINCTPHTYFLAIKWDFTYCFGISGAWLFTKPLRWNQASSCMKKNAESTIPLRTDCNFQQQKFMHNWICKNQPLDHWQFVQIKPKNRTYFSPVATQVHNTIFWRLHILWITPSKLAYTQTVELL
jgi:hypothetical protein